MNKTFIWGGGSMCRLLIPYLKIIGRNYFNIFDPFIKEIYFPFDGKHFTNEKDIKKYLPTILQDNYLLFIRLTIGGFVWCILSYPLRMYVVFA